MAWAFATLGLRDEPLLDALAAAAISKRIELNSQNISNMAWAYA